MVETPLAKAIIWIDGELRANPQANLADLTSEAGRRFNLGPKDGEFLFNRMVERRRAKPPSGKEG